MIRVLNESDVSLITSGQAITCLPHILKELIENSFDALSNEIVINISDWGLGRVSVSDNGIGIGDGCEVLLKKRASSKSEMGLLGFRGEALFALGTLSSITIESLREGESTVWVVGDIDKVPNPKRTSSGTTVIFDALFRNYPVRRREFEKSVKRHFCEAVKEVQALAISHPSVNFFFTHTISGVSSKVLSTSGSGDFRKCVGEIYGGRFSATLCDVNFTVVVPRGTITIEGCISKIRSGRLSLDHAVVLLNSRIVDFPLLTKAICDIYKEYSANSEVRAYPAILLHIHGFNSIAYDVNLSPNKKMLVLEDEDLIVSAISGQMRVLMRKQCEIISLQPVRKMHYGDQSPPLPLTFPSRKRTRSPIEELETICFEEVVEFGCISHSVKCVSDFHYPDEHCIPYSPNVSKVSLQQSDSELSQLLSKETFKTMKVIGQFNRGFIVVATSNNTFIIDQHAADEKFNYERILRDLIIIPQPLVKSAYVFLDPSEVELVMLNQEQLAKEGFTVEKCPTGGINVTSIPTLPYETVSPSDIIELVQQLVTYGSIVKRMKAVWHSCATKACRSSIMVGRVLDEVTMTKIVRRLGDLDHPWCCPHGRPTIRLIGKIG